MRFYRYKITMTDDTFYGIVVGSSLGDAADRVVYSFCTDDKANEEITAIEIGLLAPDEDGVLLLNKTLLDEIADDIIW